MRVQHDHLYQVDFQHLHYSPSFVLPTLHRGECPVRAITTCEICVVADDVKRVVSSGFAKCAEADRFSKEVGRQIALKRAVQTLSRPLRGAILHAYFTRHLTNGGG